ncbi:MAG: diaminopimelate epimerase [Deltaproteobacteria bacterium]|nr:MAG: diaminopimelate epimerase [Deltaproteobacteria bacterium]
MRDIEFYKMSGSGNDFILIDNRRNQLDVTPRSRLARALCRRRMSVGADGLIIIENSDKADFKWHFLNSDGSEGEMCGNGARCAARFAYLNGIAGSKMAFETRAGRIHAEIDDARVKIRMTDPHGLSMGETLKMDDRVRTVHRINTGVPHVILAVEDIEGVAIESLGPAIRHHPQFAPDGTNVNFIQPLSDKTIAIRTYERGVEAETLACGTGAVASAIVASRLFHMEPPLVMMTRSGLPLEVTFTGSGNRFEAACLKGDARVIYRARLGEDAQ